VVAGAEDDLGVEQVRFFQDGSLGSIDSAGPDFQWTWTAPQTAGIVELSVDARDGAGHEAFSEARQITVIPDPLTAVLGLVVDVDGLGVGGASVTIRTDSGTLTTGITASDGSFEVGALPSVEGSLRVFASETSGGVTRVASLAEPLAPAPGSIVDAGVLVLAVAVGPTTTVVGQVVDGAGDPVAGALVRVHNRYEKRETSSLSDGTFRLEGMPATTLSASSGEISSVLYVSAFAALGGEAQRGKRAFPISPRAGEETTVGTLRLEAVPDPDGGTQAQGRVVEGVGFGLADATVAISTDFDLYTTVSGVDGTYALSGVPARDGRLFATAEALREGRRVTAKGISIPLPVEGGVTLMGDVRFDAGGGCDGPCDAHAPQTPTG
jgi:hypothetical protein